MMGPNLKCVEFEVVLFFNNFMEVKFSYYKISYSKEQFSGI